MEKVNQPKSTLPRKITIDEAIKNLIAELRVQRLLRDKPTMAAIKLSIAALREIKWLRYKNELHPYTPLPGEKED